MPFRETQIPHLSFALLTLLLIYSCTSLKILPAEKPKVDPFSRVYAVPFKDFHPKLNQALQKYAREKPGNSFQVTRLGSDLVIIRGSYQKEPNQARLTVVITTRPAGSERTTLEIKPSAGQGGTSPGLVVASAGELFQIVEKETGFLPVE
jgi:hypothetical protein